MTETILLDRLRTSDEGTFGQLIRQGRQIAVTCELAWQDNLPKISCIPRGTYRVTRYRSPSKGDVFLLHGTEPRSMVEIHVGNTILDIEGCILVGMDYGEVKGRPAVISSKAAMGQLLRDLPDEFYIEIKGVCG